MSPGPGEYNNNNDTSTTKKLGGGASGIKFGNESRQ